MFEQQEIDNILNLMQYHYSLMIFHSLGAESLTDVDRQLLLTYGFDVDKFKQAFPPYLQMFMLGQLTAMLDYKNANELSQRDFNAYLNKGQFVPLSEREREEFEISRQMTYSHLKGLANKVTDSTRDMILEQNKMSLVKETISEAIKRRQSIGSIISDLGHKTGEWDRDWKRIVVTEMQNIYNQGRASLIAKKFGSNSLVYKDVYPGACRHCIRLYTTAGIGSEPRLFTLDELISNGNNIGRPVADWLPIVGATHPHCRCDLRNIHRGQQWDQEKKQWRYPEGQELKTKGNSKVKVVINDKEFYV